MRGVVAQVLLGLVAVAAAPRSKPYNSRRTNVGREHDMTLGYLRCDTAVWLYGWLRRVGALWLVAAPGFGLQQLGERIR